MINLKSYCFTLFFFNTLLQKQSFDCPHHAHGVCPQWVKWILITFGHLLIYIYFFLFVIEEELSLQPMIHRHIHLLKIYRNWLNTNSIIQYSYGKIKIMKAIGYHINIPKSSDSIRKRKKNNPTVDRQPSAETRSRFRPPILLESNTTTQTQIWL